MCTTEAANGIITEALMDTFGACTRAGVDSMWTTVVIEHIDVDSMLFLSVLRELANIKDISDRDNLIA
jgi:hypothetical protein